MHHFLGTRDLQYASELCGRVVRICLESEGLGVLQRVAVLWQLHELADLLGIVLRVSCHLFSRVRCSASRGSQRSQC